MDGFMICYTRTSRAFRVSGLSTHWSDSESIGSQALHMFVRRKGTGTV